LVKGGGIIKRRSVLVMLMILCMVLPYSGVTFASTEIQGTSNFTISNLVNEDGSDLQNLSKDQTKNLVDHNSSVERGSTTFKMNEIQVAAVDLKSYVDKNHKLPSTVKISSKDVSMSQFLQILVTAVLQIKNGQSTSVELKNVAAPTNPVPLVNPSGVKTSEAYFS